MWFEYPVSSHWRTLIFYLQGIIGRRWSLSQGCELTSTSSLSTGTSVPDLCRLCACCYCLCELRCLLVLLCLEALFPRHSPFSLALTIFLPSVLQVSLNPEVRDLMRHLIKDWVFQVLSFSAYCTNASLFICSIYYRRKPLWWCPRKTLIYERSWWAECDQESLYWYSPLAKQ